VADTRVDDTGQVLTSSHEMEADLNRLRSMVEQADVDNARAFVKELEARWPDSERVRYWSRVLAPPVVRVGAGNTGRSYALEDAWLHEHGREYPGCWLALLGDRLIAADKDFAVVLAAARQISQAESALFHFQPAPESRR
jgi:hypothetical protein